MPLREASTIEIDRHALRHGEEAAGWIIVLQWEVDPMWTEGGPNSEGVAVNNVLYPTLDCAIEHAVTIAASYRVTVKALRGYPL